MTSNYDSGAGPGETTDRLKEELGNRARAASREFADRGKAEAEALSSKAADALEDAEAIADIEAEELERRGWTDLSAYVREMADGIGSLSENLRHRSVDELVRDASKLAARNTGLFVLGSIAIGFGLSRFVKAAPSASASASARDSDAQHSYADPDTWSEAGGETSSYAPGDEYRPYESH